MAEATETKPAEKKTAAKKKRLPPKVAIIDENGCTGCEVCIELCPVDCIYKYESEDAMTGVVQVDIEKCIGCSICAQYCPWETIPMVDNPLLLSEGPEEEKKAA